jgi:signal transduction histidine kinase
VSSGPERDALELPPQWWARVAHDLRGPLGPMRMALQLLRAGRAEAGEREEALQVMDRQLERLLVEIDDVGDLLRIHGGAPVQRPRVEDLNLLLDAVCGRGALRRALAERNQTLACEAAAEELAAAHDASRLGVLFDFLLRKVSVHAPSGAELRIALRDGGDEAVFELSGHEPGLRTDPELAFLLGDGGDDVTRLGARPVLLRALLRDGAGTLVAQADPPRLALSIPLARA